MMKRLSLELGGKNSALAFDNANLVGKSCQD